MAELWFRFYPRNWRAAVRGLSPIAKAVWHDMTLIMRESNPRGFFVGASGEPVDVRAFAKDNDYKPAEVRKAIMELQNKNVCSVDSFGRIYCRFIVRETLREDQAREYGAMGGSPLLNPVRDNPGVKPNGLTHDATNGLTGALRSRGQEKKTEIDSDSLRSSATAFGNWPDDIAGLKRLSLLFIAAFASCRDPLKAEKHVGPYTGVLAQMRSRRASIATAWQAFQDALEAHGRPLFGASAKAAMSFVPQAPLRAVSAPANGSTLGDFVAELRSQETASRG